jgi:hypothetical protein
MRFAVLVVIIFRRIVGRKNIRFGDVLYCGWWHRVPTKRTHQTTKCYNTQATLLSFPVLQCHRLEMGCISKRDGSTREPELSVRSSEMQRNMPEFKLVSGMTKFTEYRIYI